MIIIAMEPVPHLVFSKTPLDRKNLAMCKTHLVDVRSVDISVIFLMFCMENHSRVWDQCQPIFSLKLSLTNQISLNLSLISDFVVVAEIQSVF